MFGFETIGKILGYGKEEPDLINDKILCIYAELKNTGVGDKDISALSRRIAASNGVVVDDDFYKNFAESCTDRGIFRVYLSEQYAEAYVDTLKADSSVKSAALYCYNDPSKLSLKKAFPEVFEGLYYCEFCNKPLASEEAFCVNNTCRMAVQNMRETNKQLIEAGQMEEILPEWRTKTDGDYTYHCHCHSITFTSDTAPDSCGEINCPGCGEWVNGIDEEEEEDEF